MRARVLAPAAGALLAALLLAGCGQRPPQPLAPVLACAAATLGSPVVPSPRVRAITQDDMAARFGPYQGYFTVASSGGQPTIWLVGGAARRVLAHEAARAVAHATGQPFTPALDARVRRACTPRAPGSPGSIVQRSED